MKTLREHMLGQGVQVAAVESASVRDKMRIIIRGGGAYASLTPRQAAMLCGALRQLDNEGLLEGG